MRQASRAIRNVNQDATRLMQKPIRAIRPTIGHRQAQNNSNSNEPVELRQASSKYARHMIIEEDTNPDKSLESKLIDTFLNLEVLDLNLFRAHHLLSGTRDSTNVFGGQVIGQALQAANRTVDDQTYHPHALHCHFLTFGNINKPILYMVDRVRDGNSYMTRHVQAIQNGETIFTAHIAYHLQEPDAIQHQTPMPAVDPPEDLVDAADLLKFLIKDENFSEQMRSSWRRQLENLPKTFYIKPMSPHLFTSLEGGHPRLAMWVKTIDPIGSDDRLHHCAAGFISDISMIATAIAPHVANGFKAGMLTTLNHSMWIHKRSFRIDDWMLYETDSPTAGAGRAMIFGRLWTRDGKLVMTTAQEGCIRGIRPKI